MKKFLKWTGIVLGGLVILLVLIVLALYWYFGGFGSEYPSGGKLSKNQSYYDVSYYDINLNVDSEKHFISGYTNIKIKSTNDSLNTIELDLIDLFQIDKILINNSEVKSYTHPEHKIFINLDDPIRAASFTFVTVFYHGEPPEAKRPPWSGGFNWSLDDSGNVWTGLSCQGEGAKIWFPCKDHPSDEPDSAAINITVPDTLFVASNGLLRNVSIPKPGFKTYHWFTGYPINNYLINFGIGKFELVQSEYVAENGTVVPVDFYVLPQLRNGAESFLDMAVDMLTTYRKFYGEYPWIKEKFGLLNTDYAGMEHQTLIAYGNKYHFSKIDSLEYDQLLLHEMGHEWWGNKITAGNWADFWLHEGICTYGEALYVLDKKGEQSYHKYMKRIKKHITNFSPVALHGDADSNEGYSVDIYNKGAAFMHMLRYVLGDSVFFKTLKQFATDSVYVSPNTVVTQDFLDLVNRNSGKDYTDLFNLYLYTTDIPEVEVDSLAEGTFSISIPNINFQLPIDVDYDGKSERMLLGNKAVTINSVYRPVVDKTDWYLKKIENN